MANITAQMVKELRDKTDAGMMDCKKALAATDGNMEAAVEFLRKAGITKAEKRSAKAVKEGKIYIASNENAAVMVEVLSETDFVAKNEKFLAYVKDAATRILAGTKGDGDITAQAQEIEKENLVQMISTIGENMMLRRAYRYETSAKIGSYLHLGGKIGVMVEVEGEIPANVVLSDICMHIAAYRPEFITSADVPADRIAKEKEIASAQLIEQKKPANMIDKIVCGKINKWYSEVCLVNQPWLRDEKTSLIKIAPKMVVKRFARWEVGQELA